MAEQTRLRLQPVVPGPVLAQRCCCKEWVPNWCCRANVYKLRLEQLHAERRQEDAQQGLVLDVDGFLKDMVGW